MTVPRRSAVNHWATGLKPAEPPLTPLSGKAALTGVLRGKT